MKLLRITALSLAATVAGCGIARQDVNEPLDAVRIQGLVPGETTARQVVELLGGPNEVVQLGRRTAYRYDSSTTKSAVLFLFVVNLANQDTRQDRLWVFFDERDVLTHYGATYGSHRTRYAMPWQDMDDPDKNAAADAERPGVGK